MRKEVWPLPSPCRFGCRLLSPRVAIPHFAYNVVKSMNGRDRLAEFGKLKIDRIFGQEVRKLDRRVGVRGFVVLIVLTLGAATGVGAEEGERRGEIGIHHGLLSLGFGRRMPTRAGVFRWDIRLEPTFGERVDPDLS